MPSIYAGAHLFARFAQNHQEAAKLASTHPDVVQPGDSSRLEAFRRRHIAQPASLCSKEVIVHQKPYR